MKMEDKYRSIIIFSYILLILCTIILFISIWNHLSINPDVRIGIGMYLLIFMIIILSTSIFVLHLLVEQGIHPLNEQESEKSVKPVPDQPEKKADAYFAPYEVDIDEISEIIVPRINPKETIDDYGERILTNLAKHFEIVQGIFYLKNPEKDQFESLSTFAYTSEDKPPPFKIGEGVSGQVAKNKTLLNLKQLPENYLTIQSGLGEGAPRNLLILPLLLNKETIGIIELASFLEIDKEKEWTFKNLAKIIGNAIVTKTRAGEQQ
jgi:hypothetical protein